MERAAYGNHRLHLHVRLRIPSDENHAAWHFLLHRLDIREERRGRGGSGVRHRLRPLEARRCPNAGEALVYRSVSSNRSPVGTCEAGRPLAVAGIHRKFANEPSKTELNRNAPLPASACRPAGRRTIAFTDWGVFNQPARDMSYRLHPVPLSPCDLYGDADSCDCRGGRYRYRLPRLHEV